MARLIMIGVCPRCGKTLTSKFPFELAECSCSNPHTEAKLQLAIIPAKRHIKHLQEVAEFRGVGIKKLVAELLDIWL